MYIDSLMALACPQSSLPMLLKLLFCMGCPVACECPCMGKGCLRCFLLLSPMSWMFLLCIPHCSLLEGTGICRLDHFLLSLGSQSSGFIRVCLMVVFPLTCTCIPYLLHTCLMLSAAPFVYGMTICPIVALLICLLLVVLLVWLLLVVLPFLSPLVLLLLMELLLLYPPSCSLDFFVPF